MTTICHIKRGHERLCFFSFATTYIAKHVLGCILEGFFGGIGERAFVQSFAVELSKFLYASSNCTAFVHRMGVRGSMESAGISEKSVAAAADVLQASPSFEPVACDFWK